MMSQGKIEQVPVQLQKVFAQMEQRILDDLVERITIAEEIISVSDWQLNRLYETGRSRKEIDQALQEALGYTDADKLEELYRNTVGEDYVRNVELYQNAGLPVIPLEENQELQEFIRAVAEQTAGTFRNFTNSLGMRYNKNGRVIERHLTEAYMDILDGAVTDILLGAADYHTVLQRAVKDLKNSGIRYIDFRNGKSFNVVGHARTCIMTGFGQIAGKANESLARQIGTDTYEVSWHAGARPSHQPWQGRVYRYEELVSECGLGSAGGLCGANCYHMYYPFVEGASTRTYTDAWLDRMNEQENEKAAYNGKEYTTYQALQQQRKMERSMRAQRQEISMYKAAEEDKMVIESRTKYRSQMKQYSEFSKAMDLPEQRERIYMDGLGRV